MAILVNRVYKNNTNYLLAYFIILLCLSSTKWEYIYNGHKLLHYAKYDCFLGGAGHRLQVWLPLHKQVCGGCEREPTAILQVHVPPRP